MTVVMSDDWLTIHGGDCRDVLATMPAGSVHCVITSPPYWGLRDYGTASWDGGDAACDHGPDRRGGRFATPVSSKQASNQGSGTISSRECPCGAVRQDRQIGLEATPDCGRRGKFRLRADLTAEQREYVVRRLAGVEPHGV